MRPTHETKQAFEPTQGNLASQDNYRYEFTDPKVPNLCPICGYAKASLEVPETQARAMCHSCQQSVCVNCIVITDKSIREVLNNQEMANIQIHTLEKLQNFTCLYCFSLKGGFT